MKTPWGHHDSIRVLEPGLFLVSTPSHGGVGVSDDYATEHLSQVARDMASFHQEDTYWYEEDCAWAIPAWEVRNRCWPAWINKEIKRGVKAKFEREVLETLSRWNPDYLKKTGKASKLVQPLYERYLRGKARNALQAIRCPELIVSVTRFPLDTTKAVLRTADNKYYLAHRAAAIHVMRQPIPLLCDMGTVKQLTVMQVIHYDTQYRRSVTLWKTQALKSKPVLINLAA